MRTPDGFEPHYRKSPLTDPWEPLYSKVDDKSVVLGFFAAEHDVVGGLVTVNLNVDFLGTARLGQWIEINSPFTKTGRTLDFAQTFVTTDGTVCARANATFRVLPSSDSRKR